VAFFRLASEEVDGVPRLCMSFQRFDPGTGVPPQITDNLTIALAVEAGELAGACEGVEIAVLDALFDGEPPAITSLTLALSSNTSRIGLPSISARRPPPRCSASKRRSARTSPMPRSSPTTRRCHGR
jgi:hypothetical protein